MNKNTKDKIVKSAVLFAVIGLLAACANNTAKVDESVPVGIDEQMIWSSEDSRPGWTLEEPETKKGVMSFVGLSGTHATEKSGREDARRNAVNAIVSYMGVLAKEKFERAQVSFGLDSSVVDPTSSARIFEKQLSTNVVSSMRTHQWYIEKWQTPTGIGYRIFVLAKLPEEALDESYKNMARNMAKRAEQEAKQAADEIAKEQAAKAVDFWNQMEEQGLTE